MDDGGFPKVLKDIFNPTDPTSLELDSVFQLKQLCKTFYEKKMALSKNLVQSLDSMANERPWVMKIKNKNFLSVSNNLLKDLERMRIKSELLRIQKYETILKDMGFKYYKILKNLSNEKQIFKEEVNNSMTTEDPQGKIKAAIKEHKLNNLLNYMTGKFFIYNFLDFLKQTIENGNEFNHSQFFMLLMTLEADEITEPLIIKAIKIIKDQLQVNQDEYIQFAAGLKDVQQMQAFHEIHDSLFPEAVRRKD